MMLYTVKLTVTTDGSGDGTATSNAIQGTLYAVQWIDGDFANGVDGTFTVTGTDAAVDYTILTLTDANDDAMYYPREQLQTSAGAGATYDGTNEIYGVEPPIVGKVKLTVAQGGATKTGGAVLFIRR
jgi:hypothetical protein